MTGRGVGAISSIGLFGDGAEVVLRKIFKPTSGDAAEFKAGEIFLGQIGSGGEVIDQVTIGCEGENHFAINCHGNPLIVEMIMELLARESVRLITAEQFLFNVLAAEGKYNTLTIEAKIEQVKAKTIEGTQIIYNQIEGGLNEACQRWLADIEAVDAIKAEAEGILCRSRTAKLIIRGCVAVLAGPANSGKSTLLNCLCGRDKAIVTDIKGTTRDWVSGRCRLKGLSVKLIDTAGLYEEAVINEDATVEKLSQEKSVEVLEKADLVLLVLDGNEGGVQLTKRLIELIEEKKVLTVLNKSDLPARFDIGELPETLINLIWISAKSERGIDDLKEKILHTTGVAGFDIEETVCFTLRQERLLRQLCSVKNKEEGHSAITELLNGRI